MDMDDIRANRSPASLWPLASSPERARWAAQAVERYLHMVRIIMSRAAGWLAPEAPFPPQALDLARPLYDAIARRVDELGRPLLSTLGLGTIGGFGYPR